MSIPVQPSNGVTVFQRQEHPVCLAARRETLIAPCYSTLEFVVAPPVLISSVIFHRPTDRNPLRAPETMLPFEIS
jgi:hypothetical protein